VSLQPQGEYLLTGGETEPCQLNPKSEARNPKQIQMLQIRIIQTHTYAASVCAGSCSSVASWFRTFENSDFVFVSDFDIRYSNFGRSRLPKIAKISSGTPPDVECVNKN
jgi:hypothetical protein